MPKVEISPGVAQQPCCKKYWGSSGHCSWLQFFSKLSHKARGLRGKQLWLEGRSTPHSVTLIFWAPLLSLECFQITAYLDFSWELRGVFPWTDEQKYIKWLELSLQEQQTQSSPTAWAVRVIGSSVCVWYFSYLRLNMKRLRYSLCRLLGELQHHLIFVFLFEEMPHETALLHRINL